jgi:ubiquinone/menaquinone biosynthesis C-methylase UbiE
MIVDVGTGSGLWALEVAEEYPHTQIIGTDLSPVQPTEDIPPNCQFRVESLLEGLNFNDGSIDLVHSRYTP